jgi:hypothetical protein
MGDSVTGRGHPDLPAALACLLLVALWLVLFRPGYSVMGGGDFALYLLHAQALAEARPYGETGFVYNPANAIMSPATYPPGLPLLLAPVVALFGLDFTAIKLVMLAALLGMLWALHRLALPEFGPRWSAVLVLAAGLSPAILMRRDAIGADMPFAAWCLLALLGARGRPALLAIGVALALLTRSIGIVLVVALALDLLFRAAPMRRRLAPALAAGVAVAAAGTLLLPADNATYAGYFNRLDPAGLVRHLIGAAQAYGLAVVELFGLSFGRLANAPVLLALVALIALGLFQRLRRGPDAVSLFVLLYGAALVAYPVHLEPTRYALPILPLLLLLALEPVHRRIPLPAALAVLALLYVPYYATRDPAAQSPLVADSPEVEALVARMQEAPPGTLFLARNPRLWALLAARPTVAWPEHLTPEGFGATVATFRPAYLVEERWLRTDEATTLAAIAAALPVIYENPAYRLRAIPAAAPGR